MAICSKFALRLGLGIAFVGSQVWVSVAFAQQQQQFPITVTSNGGTPLVVDGFEAERVPVGVLPGSEICAPGPVVYKSEGERWLFQQWSDGTTDPCVTLTKPGSYRAIYAHEVLVVIKSTAPGVQRSIWAAYAKPMKLDVPPTIERNPETRFRFESWSDGERLFDPSNTIAPVKPIVLEVRWIREHHLQVDGPEAANLLGSGWYTDGTNLVLRAPEMLPGSSDQERFKFAQWETTSFPPAALQNPQSPTTTVNIQMPYTIRAVYQKQYLVSATSPLGTLKRDWVSDGEEVILEAPSISDIVPDLDRLVFKRWEGMDGPLSPKIIGKVDKPINVTAVYERQVSLKVNAPHGATGDGWQKAGSVATISVPATYAEMFLLNSTFTAFGGYPPGQTSIQVLVNEPTTLTALYRTEPNAPILLMVLLLPLLAVLTYFAITRAWFKRATRHIAHTYSRVRRPKPMVEHTLSATARFPGRNGVHLPVPVGEEQRF
jgi:hypothetical protein